MSVGDGAFPFHRKRFPKLESGEDLNSSSHLRRHFFSDLSQFPPVDVERRVRASRERETAADHVTGIESWRESGTAGVNCLQEDPSLLRRRLIFLVLVLRSLTGSSTRVTSRLQCPCTRNEGEGPQTHEVQDDEVTLVTDSRAVEFDTFVLHQLFL